MDTLARSQPCLAQGDVARKRQRRGSGTGQGGQRVPFSPATSWAKALGPGKAGQPGSGKGSLKSTRPPHSPSGINHVTGHNRIACPLVPTGIHAILLLNVEAPWALMATEGAPQRGSCCERHSVALGILPSGGLSVGTGQHPTASKLATYEEDQLAHTKSVRKQIHHKYPSSLWVFSPRAAAQSRQAELIPRKPLQTLPPTAPLGTGASPVVHAPLPLPVRENHSIFSKERDGNGLICLDKITQQFKTATEATTPAQVRVAAFLRQTASLTSR